MAWLLKYQQNVRGMIRSSLISDKNKLFLVTQLENAELEYLKYVRIFYLAFIDKRLSSTVINGILQS